MKTIMRWFGVVSLTLGVVSLVPGLANAADNPAGFETSAVKNNDCSAKDPIKVGYSSWSEDVLEAKLLKRLLEKRYGCEVQTQRLSVGVKFQALAKRDIDVMFEAWFPKTHKSYWEKFSTKMWNVGPLYMGAQLGWAVPDYVPKDEVSSIKDLKKDSVRKKMGGKVQGIDPGSGLMQHSQDAMTDYGLNDYNLIKASGTAMTAALQRAIDNKEWTVVTLWTPHWAFGRFDLRFLDDPKGSLGAVEHSDKLVRAGFYQDYPTVAAMLSRMTISLSTLQGFMYDADQTSNKKAIDKFIKEHANDVHYWMTGKHSSDAT
ncbi:glycine betaine ABC transporter substrate-binding protein [Salinisphaera sp. USBA-960]|uniref:glycine betaine ABC transporter substrate-binding protein n=1 Tax=Salinisphaera orenii TaxID=856731 RepID=UPI0013A6781D|nr:glycine betaine ABC transporter substrate-binding protein [Salifodinibacter halophilus]NNC25606.1 glycine betaine ABC transporter substrate-binding protein [Salifodinibacter halophilus]